MIIECWIEGWTNMLDRLLRPLEEGEARRSYFLKNPKMRSDFASKSESDVDILRGVTDALSMSLPLTSYM